MSVIQQNIVTTRVVSGPDVKLHTNSIRSADARQRMDGLEREVNNNIERYRYKTKDKTPMIVKVAGIGVLLAVIGGLLKLRFKK